MSNNENQDNNDFNFDCPKCKSWKLKKINSKKDNKEYIICWDKDCDFIVKTWEKIEWLKCPISWDDLFENDKLYYSLLSWLVIWKTIAWHTISKEELKELFTNNFETSNIITDFYSKKTEKNFSAKLKLNKDEKKLDFIFENNN